MAQFDSVENSLHQTGNYIKRKPALIVISQRFILIFLSSLVLIIIAAIVINHQYISALKKSIVSLSHEVSSIKQIDSHNGNQLHKELSEIKEMISSLSSITGKSFSSLHDYIKITSDNSTYDLRKSYILTNLKQIGFIQRIFGLHNYQFRLIYRASYYGDEYKQLYASIKWLKFVLIVIQSKKGAIFGGYAMKQWKNNGSCLTIENNYIKDSMLFNVNREEVYELSELPVLNPHNGILSFGEDLTILNCFLSSKENYSKFPYHYNLEHKNASKNSLTEGEEFFEIQELEAYVIDQKDKS